MTITKTNIKLAGAGEITGDLMVGGGSATIMAGGDDEDATLLISGGASDKDAVIELEPDNGFSAGDEWEIRAANGGVLSFKNDIAGANELEAMMTFTPLDPITTSKLVLAGDLHLGGDLLQFTSNEKITQSSGQLLISATTTKLSGDLNVVGGTIQDNGTASIEMTGTDVAIAGDLTVTGNDLTFGNGEKIDNTADGVLDMTATTVTMSNDLTLDSDSSVISMGAGSDFTITHDGTTGATIEANPMTILSSGVIELDSATDIVLDTRNGSVELRDEANQYGELKEVASNNYNLVIVSGTTDALIFSGADVAAQGDVTVSGGDMNFTKTQVAQISVDTTDSGTDGKDLTIRAGSAPSGGNNQSGGTLYLKAGAGDGTGTSTMEFHTKIDGTDAANKAMEINADGDVVITRNLTVSGDTVTMNTETILVEDNAIMLNSNDTGTAESSPDGGIIVKRGDVLNNKNAALFWDESYAGVDSTATDLGGRWAVGIGTETGTPSAFTTPTTTFGGYIVSITEASGTPTSLSIGRSAGIGSLFCDTANDDMYIRVS